jgi:hypothetical protein
MYRKYRQGDWWSRDFRTNVIFGRLISRIVAENMIHEPG